MLHFPGVTRHQLAKMSAARRGAWSHAVAVPAFTIVVAWLLFAATACAQQPTRIRLDDDLPQDPRVYAFHWVGNRTLEINVPAPWSGTQTDFSRIVPGVDGAAFLSGPNPRGWFDGWVSSGVLMGASRELSEELELTDARMGVALDRLGDWFRRRTNASECVSSNAARYVGERYTGFVRVSAPCGGVGTTLVEMTGVPTDRSFVALLEIRLDDGDLWIVPRLLRLFHVQPGELHG